MQERPGKTLHGYQRSFVFERGGVMFAVGGQHDRALLSIPGEGCALVPDWSRLTEVFHGGFDARITRWDGSVDDHEGRRGVNDAVALYRAHQFNSNGRRPTCSVAGSWIEPDDSGRTFYVGKGKNGKLARIYEKGMQLGLKWSPWVRWEVQLRNIDRLIPWEVLTEPGRYVAGAYPALSWVSEDASRIATLRRQDTISYDNLVHYGSVGLWPPAKHDVGPRGHCRTRPGDAHSSRRSEAPRLDAIPSGIPRAARMNFERNDLDWALGELLHLIWKSKYEGERVEKRYPAEFYACMRVVNAQTFEVRSKVIEVIRAAHPEMLFVHREHVRTS